MRLGRSLLYSAGGIYAETLIGVLSSIVIARMLGADEYGAYALLLTWATFAQALANSGVTLSAITFIAQARAKDSHDVAAAIARNLRSIQRWKVLAIVAIVAVALPYYLKFSISGLDPSLIWYVLVAIALRAQYMFSISVCKGNANFRGVAFINGLGSLLNLLLVGLTALLYPTLFGFLFAFTAGSLIFFLFGAYFSARHYKVGRPVNLDNSETAQKLRKQLKVLTFTSIATYFVSSQIEIFFLGIWSTASHTGAFRLGGSLALGVTMLISGVLSFVVLPHISQAYAESRASVIASFNLTTRYLTYLVAPVVVLVVVVAPGLIQFLYGGEFAAAAIVLMVIASALAINDLNSPAQSYLLSSGRQYLLLLLTLVTLVLKGTIGAYLVYRFELIGAMASFAGTTLIIVVIKHSLVERELGVRFPWMLAIRVAAMAVIAVIPVFCFKRVLPELPALILGGAAFVFLYGALMLWGRCFTVTEVTALASIAGKLPGGSGRFISRILRESKIVRTLEGD